MSTVQIVSSPRAARTATGTHHLFDEEGYRHAREVITGWEAYRRTPIVSCPDLAARLGVEALLVKDESDRLGLKSFKSLGGAYAVHRAYERWQAAGATGEFVVTCVTDGNHGLSVALGAQNLNVRCVVYIPDVVTDQRADAIAAFGAEVLRMPGNYDEVTRISEQHAAERGWKIVTDTSSVDADLESVLDVMQGYRVLAQEIVEEWDDLGLTHIVLQAGCGGMAGAVVGHLLTRMGVAELPQVVVVEPERAACLLASARAQRPAVVTGGLQTMMAGLSVGEISLAAWQILRTTVDHFVAIPDDDVPRAMRLLRGSDGSRPPVISGETGAAGLAALLTLASSAEHAAAVGLDQGSRVLIINTEGDTDPELYRSIVGD